MMKMLRAMREPLKYVQGRDALLQFHKEMGYMGNAGCLSVRTAVTKPVMTRLKRVSVMPMIIAAMKCSAVSQATERSKR